MKEINGKIVFIENETPKFTNGSFGQVNEKGDFIMHFFHEYPDNPDSFKLVFDDNGAVTQSFEEQVPSKRVHTSLVMNVETAKSIADWINRNVEFYKDLIENKKTQQ